MQVNTNLSASRGETALYIDCDARKDFRYQQLSLFTSEEAQIQEHGDVLDQTANQWQQQGQNPGFTIHSLMLSCFINFLLFGLQIRIKVSLWEVAPCLQLTGSVAFHSLLFLMCKHKMSKTKLQMYYKQPIPIKMF